MTHYQPAVIVDSGASYMGLPANKLADKLIENNAVSWGDCTYEQHDNDNFFKKEAAAMLRKQQAEIEVLKKQLAVVMEANQRSRP
jgi:hypothetical protein